MKLLDDRRTDMLLYPADEANKHKIAFEQDFLLVVDDNAMDALARPFYVIHQGERSIGCQIEQVYLCSLGHCPQHK